MGQGDRLGKRAVRTGPFASIAWGTTKRTVPFLWTLTLHYPARGEGKKIAHPFGDMVPESRSQRLSRHWLFGRRPGRLPNPSDLPKCKLPVLWEFWQSGGRRLVVHLDKNEISGEPLRTISGVVVAHRTERAPGTPALEVPPICSTTRCQPNGTVGRNGSLENHSPSRFFALIFRSSNR